MKINSFFLGLWLSIHLTPAAQAKATQDPPVIPTPVDLAVSCESLALNGTYEIHFIKGNDPMYVGDFTPEKTTIRNRYNLRMKDDEGNPVEQPLILEMVNGTCRIRWLTGETYPVLSVQPTKKEILLKADEELLVVWKKKS